MKCDELKATTVYDAYWKANSTGEGTGTLVYLKSEADKVIADLEESHRMEVEQLLIEIVGLKNKLQNVSELLKETREWLIESQKMHKRCAGNAIKQLRHNKYKRCMAMARWCLTEKVYFHYRYDDWGDKGYDRSYKWKKVVFWSKWARRWLELAEKFKEAK